MKLLLRILRWALLGLVVLALVLGGGGFLWLRGALPQTAGTIKVQGISGAVEVLRDSDAVPHIRAENESDALFGLGYVHAQDRLWQMEFQRRIGNGRLSEILGAPTLGTDRFLRTLGTQRAAASALASINPDIRRLIEAYVAGVNAFISSHHGRQLPIEFAILGFEPEPWQPEDVLVWAKMMAWNLSGNWSDEILREKLTGKLGAERAAQLMPAYSVNGPIILPPSAASNGQEQQGSGRLPQSASEPLARNAARLSAESRTGAPGDAAQPSLSGSTIAGMALGAAAFDDLLAANRFLQRQLGLGGKAIGSNNWVIGGQRTTTGRPLLANDPHLGAQIPSIWYLAQISGGRYDMIGATIPGLPAVLIGHNQRIAWGATNTGPDVQDLFVERIDLQRNEVEYQGVKESMRVLSETIKVKGQADVPLQVRITRHGPLTSDGTKPGEPALAFRWTALDEQDTTIEAYMRLNIARDWGEFTGALKRYHAPMQNFVYADINNNIGYYAPGALPIRAQGDGSIPAPGWSGTYDWTGYVPFDQLPHVYNPPEGYIASANNKAVPDSYPHFMASSWAAPYRAARIIELIENRPRLSPDDIAAMQADVQSVQARELLPMLLRARPFDERAQTALTLLANWDAGLRGDSAQAAVFEAWYQQIPAQILADQLGDELWNTYRDEENIIALALPKILAGQAGDWCDDIRTQQTEDCPTVLGVALSTGLAHMADAQGRDDINSWRWERVHRAIFPHNPFDQSALKPIFSRSIPNGGDPFTVNVAPVDVDDLYNQYRVPSYRQIIDLGDLESSRFMQTVGQSGQLLSGNYSNLIPRWQRVEYLPMRYGKDAINAAADARLVLEP